MLSQTLVCLGPAGKNRFSRRRKSTGTKLRINIRHHKSFGEKDEKNTDREDETQERQHTHKAQNNRFERKK